MSFTDCVLTVDDVDHPVSLGLLAHRSGWMAGLLLATRDPAQLSEHVQTAWASVRALAGHPTDFSFSTFYEAIVTGVASTSLFHRASDGTDIVLGYFQTREVAYGWVLVEEIRYIKPEIFPFAVHYHALPRQFVTNLQLAWLKTLVHLPSKQFPKLPAVVNQDWIQVERLLNSDFVTHFRPNSYITPAGNVMSKVWADMTHDYGRVLDVISIAHQVSFN